MATDETKAAARALIKQWCDRQLELHGPDWKRIVSDRMARAASPYIEGLLKMQKVRT